MSGLDKILNIIEAQQKQTEDSIIKAAESKAEFIRADGEAKAQKAYEDYLKRSNEQAEKDYENARSSIDATAKRRILSEKVKLIDTAIDKSVEKLNALSDEDYFKLLTKLIKRNLHSGEGVISLSENDLNRVTPDFEKNINILAAEKNGTVRLADKPAGIDDGFILSYGLISENCSFRSIIESEKEGIRDTAARVLFG